MDSAGRWNCRATNCRPADAGGSRCAPSKPPQRDPDSNKFHARPIYRLLAYPPHDFRSQECAAGPRSSPADANRLAAKRGVVSQFLPWKIVNVDLRQPLPNLSADAVTGGLFVVFWDGDVPVGQWLAPGPLLPVSSVQ